MISTTTTMTLMTPNSQNIVTRANQVTDEAAEEYLAACANLDDVRRKYAHYTATQDQYKAAQLRANDAFTRYIVAVKEANKMRMLVEITPDMFG